MSKNEERLRGWCMNAPAMAATLDEVLSEVRARARAEALEEAANVADDNPDWHEGKRIARGIRAIITTPAPATIPVDRVREVLDDSGALESLSTPQLYLDGWNAALEDVARRLGVDIGAKGNGHG